MPSLSSSPWMRGAPHSGLSRANWQTRSRVRRSTRGRPGARRERQVQTRQKAERCQRMTVAGLTMMRTLRQRDHARERATQKSRSVQSRGGRGRRRRRTASCWRRARFSRPSAPRVRSADLAAASMAIRSESTRRSSSSSDAGRTNEMPTISPGSSFGERQGQRGACGPLQGQCDHPLSDESDCSPCARLQNSLPSILGCGRSAVSRTPSKVSTP